MNKKHSTGMYAARACHVCPVRGKGVGGGCTMRFVLSGRGGGTVRGVSPRGQNDKHE